MARSFQLVTIFPGLSVAETLAVAALARLHRSARPFAALARDAEVRAAVEEVAALFGLADKLGRAARTLPQGDKKLLDVASAFALHPDVILMDEPTSGVSTADKTAIMETLVQAARRMGIRAIVPGRARHGHRVRLLRPDRRAPPGARAGGRGADAIRADAEVVRTVLGIATAHAARGRVVPSSGHPRSHAGPPRASERATASHARAGLADPATTMLKIRDIDVYIDASHILRKVSLEAAPGELVCLVGRNGAGKTTTLRTVMGYLRPAAAPSCSPVSRSPAGPRTPSPRARRLCAARRAACSATSRWRRTSSSRRGRGRRAAGRRARGARL